MWIFYVEHFYLVQTRDSHSSVCKFYVVFAVSKCITSCRSKVKLFLTKGVATKHMSALVFLFFLYIRIREMLNENKNGKKQSPHPLQFTTITP
jgi:hypothetical protein